MLEDVVTPEPGIAVTRMGTGPELLLVHGGAAAWTTFGALESLADRFTLAFVHRRGYPPSPDPLGGRQDFDVDAGDLLPLLDSRPHVVCHSYGALGALIAAARAPDRVRSLTVIEPPLAHLVPGDPGVARLREIGDAVLTHGMQTDPKMLREFLAIAGAGDFRDRPLPDEVVRGVERAHGGRPTSEARVDLKSLRTAGVSAAVASGNHAPALERICDAAASALGAIRMVHEGAGHFVPAAPGFAADLERFLMARG